MRQHSLATIQANSSAALMPPPMGPKPSWTTSDYNDERWAFRQPGYRSLEIDFTTVPEKWRKLSKHFLWALEYAVDNPRARVAAPVTFYRCFREFRWLVIALDRHGFRTLFSLSYDNQVEIVGERIKGIRKSSIKEGSYRTIISVYKKLYALGPAGLGVVPDGFSIEVPWALVAPQIVTMEETGSTPLMEVAVASEIVNKAVEVLRYSEAVLALRDLRKRFMVSYFGIESEYRGILNSDRKHRLLAEIRQIAGAEQALIAVTPLVEPLGIMSSEEYENPTERVRVLHRQNIRKLLTTLTAACYSVMAALTGFRYHELTSLRVGDVFIRANRAVLRTRITKTTKSWQGVEVERTGPLLIYEIYTTVIRLSDVAGTEREIWQSTEGGFLHNQRLNLILDNFSRQFANVDWSLRTHQFRRYFAVSWLRRFNGSEDALRRHFRHSDPNSIKYYLKDKEAAKYFVEEEKILAREVFTDLVYGKGTYSAAIQSPISLLASSYRAMNLPIEEIDKRLIEALSTNFTHVRPTLWGYCLAQHHDTSGAMCGGRSGEIDLTRVLPENCLRCRHLVVGRENREFLVHLRGTHQEAMNSACATKIAKAASSSMIAQIDGVIRRFDGEER